MFDSVALECRAGMMVPTGGIMCQLGVAVSHVSGNWHEDEGAALSLDRRSQVEPQLPNEGDTHCLI